MMLLVSVGLRFNGIPVPQTGLLGWSFGGEHLRGFVESIYRYKEATVEFDTIDDYDISYDGIGANIGIMYRF